MVAIERQTLLAQEKNYEIMVELVTWCACPLWRGALPKIDVPPRVQRYLSVFNIGNMISYTILKYKGKVRGLAPISKNPLTCYETRRPFRIRCNIRNIRRPSAVRL